VLIVCDQFFGRGSMFCLGSLVLGIGFVGLPLSSCGI
jgi:hypothetical protein